VHHLAPLFRFKKQVLGMTLHWPSVNASDSNVRLNHYSKESHVQPSHRRIALPARA
jgi:hypothetical protein